MASSLGKAKRGALSDLDGNATGLQPDTSIRPVKKARNTSTIPRKKLSGLQNIYSTAKIGAAENQDPHTTSATGRMKPEGSDANQKMKENPKRKPPKKAGVHIAEVKRSEGADQESQAAGCASEPCPAQPGVRSDRSQPADEEQHVADNLHQGPEARPEAQPLPTGAAEQGASAKMPGKEESAAQAAGKLAGEGTNEAEAGQEANGGLSGGRESGGKGGQEPGRGTPLEGVNAGTGAKEAHCGVPAKGAAGHGAGEGVEGVGSGAPEPAKGNVSGPEEVHAQGPAMCTFSRCKYVAGEDGEAPDESRRDGATHGCQECGAWLHNLCGREITKKEGVYICEKCNKTRGGRSEAADANGEKQTRAGKNKLAPKRPPRPVSASAGRGQTGHQTKGAAAPPSGTPQERDGNPGREGRNGGRLGVVSCPKCNLLQESGRKFCRREGCNASIREARAAEKHAAEQEAMRAAHDAADFNMTTASKSVYDSLKKRVLIASGGRAEAVLMLAHRNEEGEKRFRFYGLGAAATLFAKNQTVQSSFKSHMERLYKKEDEEKEQANKAGLESATSDDAEVLRFLRGLGNEFVPYAERFRSEGFNMSALKLAKDENLHALGIKMGPRLRIMAAAAAYHASGQAEPQDEGPDKSTQSVTKDSHGQGESDDEGESSPGVL